MWPARRPGRGSATAALEAAGGARIDDLRAVLPISALHLGGVAHQLGMEARREMPRRAARRLAVLQRAALPPSIS